MLPLIRHKFQLVRSVVQAASHAYRSTSSLARKATAGDRQAAVSAGTFDESLLPYLACPLAKTPLRYDQQQQLLVNDDVGIAYPIVNGIPQLTPSRGYYFIRVIRHDPDIIRTEVSKQGNT